MIRSVAIDDEPRALAVLENHAGRTPFVELEATFVDPFEAIEHINAHGVDLVFLDINMPALNGIDMLQHFRQKPLVIFTTAHSEYALKSYEVEALDYLLKPFDYARFLLAVSKARDRLASRAREDAGFLFVNTGTKKERVVLDDIRYIESEGNYVRYVTDARSYLVRASIKETQEQLPAHLFVQIHRSFIVALQHIDKIEDNQVILGKKSIPLGATFREAFWQRIER